jgi:anthranilate phosphoribosyltransferase
MNNPQIAQQTMHSIIQRIATGPELSKDISLEEASQGMQAILNSAVDEVQAAIFFIALRMKRETDDENKGVLEALLQTSNSATAEVDEVVSLADPYDGFNRNLPVAPFVPMVLAELGLPTISHGLDSVGPKFGVTHRHVLQALGIEVDLTVEQAAQRIADPSLGWSYVDQQQFCPSLHELVPLRQKVIKRQVLTTVEVLLKPVTGRNKTHFVTGYVHKPYPAKYAALARHAGFNSALLVRGTEGGIIPSLRQPGKVFRYQEFGPEMSYDTHPVELGIEQNARAVPLPEYITKNSTGDEVACITDTTSAAEAAAEAGRDALQGIAGPAYDSLLYACSLILWHTGKASDLASASQQIRQVLDSGKVIARLR